MARQRRDMWQQAFGRSSAVLTRRGFGTVLLGGVAVPLLGGCVSGGAGAARMADGLPRRTPEAQGVSSAAILAFLDEVAAGGHELHSFMLARGGAVVAEGWWWPYAPERIHMTHSLTKSVTAAGVGLAIGEGRFGLDDHVVDFFPEHVPAEASDNLKAMTVRHLLTMQCGHDKETSGSAWRPIKTSWIAEFMKIPVPHRPGTKHVYTSAASYMLSAIVTRTTGQPLAAYLQPRLFDPLGINQLSWDVGPENINPGGNGLSWTTAASLKFGMLHAQHGRWHGQQLLAPAFVAEATRNHIPGGRYGFQWWMGEAGAYYAVGLFGQFSFVFPQHDAVLSLFGALPDDDDMLPIVWKHFPAAFGTSPGGTTGTALAERTAGLRLLPILAPTYSPVSRQISGRSLRAEPNAQRVETVRFDCTGDRVTFSMRDNRGLHAITAGLGTWIEQMTSMSGRQLHHGYEPDQLRVVAGARWLDPGTLEMTWQYVETAFRDTVLCRFGEEGVTIARSVNVNSGERSLPTLRAYFA